MIENERQYAITKAQAERFTQALERLTNGATGRAPVSPRLRKAEEEALRNQLTQLQAELADYESRRSE
jgi:hypothetical protein